MCETGGGSRAEDDCLGLAVGDAASAAQLVAPLFSVRVVPIWFGGTCGGEARGVEHGALGERRLVAGRGGGSRAGIPAFPGVLEVTQLQGPQPMVLHTAPDLRCTARSSPPLKVQV